MSKLLLFFCIAFTAVSAFGQKNATISGTIRDNVTGETLIGASIRIKELPQKGTATNSYGFYSITAPEGEYTLIYTYIGYSPVTQQVSLHKNQVIDMKVSPSSSLAEVVISANRPNNDQIVSPQMGVEKLNMAPDQQRAGSFGGERYPEDNHLNAWRKIRW